MVIIIIINKDKINQAFFDVFKISVIKMMSKKATSLFTKETLLTLLLKSSLLQPRQMTFGRSLIAMKNTA